MPSRFTRATAKRHPAEKGQRVAYNRRSGNFLGYEPNPRPLVIDTLAKERYYHVPKYMAPNQGDLTIRCPAHTYRLSIDSYFSIPPRVFAEGAQWKGVEATRFKVNVLFRFLGAQARYFQPGVGQSGKDVRTIQRR
jgi:hypothetical protein